MSEWQARTTAGPHRGPQLRRCSTRRLASEGAAGAAAAAASIVGGGGYSYCSDRRGFVDQCAQRSRGDPSRATELNLEYSTLLGDPSLAKFRVLSSPIWLVVPVLDSTNLKFSTTSNRSVDIDRCEIVNMCTTYILCQLTFE
eukprot:SAG31_NODE_19404_length_603_cov_1.007937_1_plen_142_part_00